MIQSSIGNSIRLWRLRRGWTQQDLAERVGMGQSVIARLESDTNPNAPTIKTLERLAKALKVRLVVRLEK
jgi:HTH-type transcriptional regulator/antitoxin HipB